MNYRTLALLVSLIFSLPAQADDLNKIMHEVGEKMSVLLPELYSDESSVEDLQQEVRVLSNLLGDAEEHFAKADTGTQITYTMLQDQLRQTSEYSAGANIGMLRADLAETFNLCASCHNQDRKFVASYGVSKFRDMDEFLAAEYSYMTRDYGAALTSYNNSLQQDIGAERSQKALDRLLVITLEVSADPKLAFETLSAAKKELAAQEELIEDLNEWLRVIERIVDEKESTQSPFAARSIKGIDNYLGNEWPVMQSLLTHNEQLVYWIAIRGRLHQLLKSSPDSPETPRLLYWLALSDRALHYRFYDSLSRRYLIQCIRDFPEHEMAEECFKEYEMLMIVSFSGSGGIYLPLEAQEEISELRRLVYSPK